MEISLVILALAILASASVVAVSLRRHGRPVAPAPDQRLDSVLSAQGAIAAQFQQAVTAQTTLAQRVDALNQRLNESLKETTEKTAATLGSIGERLNVIDNAQKNITALSGQVMSLREVLSNKQSRGAFGQAQMEEIVRDGLPSSLFEFQATLSNNSRPDCLIKLPGAGASIVIEDDGPGISPVQWPRVLERGTRLDQRGEGAGLGLAIVQDVLTAYGWRLDLARSQLGGLKATIAPSAAG